VESTLDAVLWTFLRGSVHGAVLKRWCRLGGAILAESFRDEAHTAGPSRDLGLPEGT